MAWSYTCTYHPWYSEYHGTIGTYCTRVLEYVLEYTGTRVPWYDGTIGSKPHFLEGRHIVEWNLCLEAARHEPRTFARTTPFATSRSAHQPRSAHPSNNQAPCIDRRAGLTPGRALHATTRRGRSERRRRSGRKSTAACRRCLWALTTRCGALRPVAVSGDAETRRLRGSRSGLPRAG